MLLYIKMIFLSYFKNLAPFWIKIAILLLGKINKVANSHTKGKRCLRKILQTHRGQMYFLPRKEELRSSLSCGRVEAALPPAVRVDTGLWVFSEEGQWHSGEAGVGQETIASGQNLLFFSLKQTNKNPSTKSKGKVATLFLIVLNVDDNPNYINIYTHTSLSSDF